MIYVQWGQHSLLEGSETDLGAKQGNSRCQVLSENMFSSPNTLQNKYKEQSRYRLEMKTYKERRLSLGVGSGFGTAAGRFLLASQKRSNLSNVCPHKGDIGGRTTPHCLQWKGYILRTTTMHLLIEFLTIQLIPQTPRQHKALFLSSLFQYLCLLQISKYKPVFKRQLHDCHQWCKIIHLFPFTVSLSLSFSCIWICMDRGSLFLPHPFVLGTQYRVVCSKKAT